MGCGVGSVNALAYLGPRPRALAVKRHSSAAGNSPRTCALARGHPHHPQPSHAERNPSTQPLTFMRTEPFSAKGGSLAVAAG